MTPPHASDGAAATRPPLFLLVLLYLVPFVAAFATPVSDFVGPQGDVSLYLEKARGVASGLIPYRDIPLEYPPFALVPMAVPYLLWPIGAPSLTAYAWLFAGEQAILLVAVALFLGRIVRLSGAPSPAASPGPEASRDRMLGLQRLVGWRLLLLAVGASLAITWRFDLLPTLLATVALWAALESRPVAAGVVAGAGILTKLFPLAIVPALAVAWLAPMDRRRLLRFFEAVVGSVVVGMAPFIALAGVEALIFVAYQAERGLQIESIGGALVLFGGLLRGQPIPLVSPFSAHEVTGERAELLTAALPFLTVAAYAALGWFGWRRVKADVDRRGGVTPARIVALTTASILVLLVTSKVFSIQYVVWLVPFAALLPKWQFRLAAVIVALTIPIHPLLYDALVRQEAVPIVVLNLRNALLLLLTLWVVADLWPRGVRDARN